MREKRGKEKLKQDEPSATARYYLHMQKSHRYDLLQNNLLELVYTYAGFEKVKEFHLSTIKKIKSQVKQLTSESAKSDLTTISSRIKAEFLHLKIIAKLQFLFISLVKNPYKVSNYQGQFYRPKNHS